WVCTRRRLGTGFGREWRGGTGPAKLLLAVMPWRQIADSARNALGGHMTMSPPPPTPNSPPPPPLPAPPRHPRTPTSPVASAAATPGKRRFAGLLWLVVLMALAALTLAFAWPWWSYRRTHSITEDAFVEAHIVNVAPEMVSGRVVRFLAEENDHVEQG